MDPSSRSVPQRTQRLAFRAECRGFDPRLPLHTFDPTVVSARLQQAPAGGVDQRVVDNRDCRHQQPESG